MSIEEGHTTLAERGGRAERGEGIRVPRHGAPVAKQVAVEPAAPEDQRQLGLWR
ncbi:MAG: hypothetical protein ACK5YI_19180 [Rhodospirillales bacterium]